MEVVDGKFQMEISSKEDVKGWQNRMFRNPPWLSEFAPTQKGVRPVRQIIVHRTLADDYTELQYMGGPVNYCPVTNKADVFLRQSLLDEHGVRYANKPGVSGPMYYARTIVDSERVVPSLVALCLRSIAAHHPGMYNKLPDDDLTYDFQFELSRPDALMSVSGYPAWASDARKQTGLPRELLTTPEFGKPYLTIDLSCVDDPPTFVDSGLLTADGIPNPDGPGDPWASPKIVQHCWCGRQKLFCRRDMLAMKEAEVNGYVTLACQGCGNRFDNFSFEHQHVAFCPYLLFPLEQKLESTDAGKMALVCSQFPCNGVMCMQCVSAIHQSTHPRPVALPFHYQPPILKFSLIGIVKHLSRNITDGTWEANRTGPLPRFYSEDELQEGLGHVLSSSSSSDNSDSDYEPSD